MPAIELEFKEGSKVPIYIENLHRHDNELFEKQIRELGDAQHRKSNVKADMTEWLLTKYESFIGLLWLYGEMFITREIIQIRMTICLQHILLHIMLKFQTDRLL